MSRVQAGFMADFVQRLSAFLNYEFCPWANRYERWLRQPIGWFIVGAAAAALIAVVLIGFIWFMIWTRSP